MILLFEKQYCYCDNSVMSNVLSFLWVTYRYGPWMDTNLVLPLGPRTCKVVFDYFLEASLKVIFCLLMHYYSGIRVNAAHKVCICIVVTLTCYKLKYV